jgi:flagellar motor component MotA
MTKDEFETAYIAFLKTALALAAKARKESILGLKADIDPQKAAQRDILHYGLKFAVDGTAGEIIDTTITNIRDQEKDEWQWKLKTIQKQTVLAILDGLGAEILRPLLNSFTHLSIEEEDKLLGTENKEGETK